MRPTYRFSLSLLALIFMAIPVAPAGAAGSGTLNTTLLYAEKTGKASRLACFVRRYDDAHLASHPKQNVRIMRLLAQRYGDGEEESNGLQIGVYFRGVKKRFDVDGSCRPDPDHPGALSCGIDCDGGAFGLRQTGPNTLLVDIPTGVQASTEGEEGARSSDNAHGKARFGSDDKTFRLDRADLKECQAMINETAQ